MPRITVVPLSRYYRKCDFWLAVEHRPSGDVITPLDEDGVRRDLAAAHQEGFRSIAIVFMLLMPLIFHRLVGRRIQRASKTMELVGETGELSNRIGDGSRDELGRMCGLFDQLTKRLQAEREVDAEIEAGR